MANPALNMLRQLLSEIRRNTYDGNLKDSLMKRYIMVQYKKYRITDQQICKAQNEMKYLAESYLCYLQSQRHYIDIHRQYHGKGERSTQDIANLVGFKLPHDPK